ncbi:MAG TPA: hypothetical protein GX396_06205 [Tissierellia bacterium]|nr:hypothetical protein [Tissierellia bacterium]
MRKVTLLITLLTLVLISACTKLPPSEETGVGPGEYKGIVHREDIIEENESLKEELDIIKKELEELQKENENLANKEENLVSMLEEAQSKLKIIESEDVPQFSVENADLDSIVSYLKDSGNLLNDSLKGIEIIKEDHPLVFRTIGYGENYSQIFIWEEGNKEPFLIEGGVIDKEGSYSWLGEYLLITDSKSESKVLDINNKKITGSFKDAQKIYLIEGTTVILFKDSNNNFLLYDFIKDSTKQINLDSSKYTDFNLKNNDIVFMGEYIDNNGIEYEIKASLSLDKLKEIYELNNSVETVESQETGDTV